MFSILILLFSVINIGVTSAHAEQDGQESDQGDVVSETDEQVDDENEQDNTDETEETEETETKDGNTETDETETEPSTEDDTENSDSRDEKENEVEYEADDNESNDKEKVQTQAVETTILENGVRDSRVVQLKKDLAKLGFVVEGNGTKLYGTKTEQQVKKFQGYYGLEETGVADDETLAKIDEILSSPMQNGKRHEDTVELKNNLAQIGFAVPGNGTTLYGKETEKKVKELQSVHQLVVNGIADDVTLAKIDELLDTELSNGMRHESVKQLKRDLDRLGFTVPGNGTTLFGKKTEQQVQAFQEYYGLPITGAVDETTRLKMGNILSTPLQNGNRHSDTVQLKKDLGQLGFAVPGNGTKLYGKDTEKKVKAFQSFYGLVENGIADEVTLSKIEEMLEAPLSNGMRRQDVKQLKRDLGQLGFPVPGNGTTLFGKDTEEKVKEFQRHYALEVTGVVDSETQDKIAEVLASPLQNGKRHQDTVQLKKNLAQLGLTVPGNGTKLYGKETEKKVKEFQTIYNLPVSGIADEITLTKIDELLDHTPLSNGMRDESVKLLKRHLAQLGFPVPGNGTTLFGKDTEKKVKEFQEYYGLKVTGVVYESTQSKITDILSSPLQNGNRHQDTVQLKKDLAQLGFAVPGNGTKLYGKKTEEKVREFQSYYGLTVNGIADEVTLVKIDDMLSHPLQNGKRHSDVIQLKKDLAQLGYKVSNSPTTLYGSKTTKQVKQFQKDNQLPQSGIADGKTMDLIAQKLKQDVVKIFLDPGHGGKDPGAKGFGLQEKDVVLDISKHAADVLTTKYIGVDVKLSRTTDRFVELIDRANMANNWGADYFISVHNNSFNGSASGFESYIYNGNVSQQTKELQSQMHNYLAKELGLRDRGAKTANFSVLRNTSMPAILLEYLFIDNSVENALLSDSSYRKWLGEITADAIAHSFNLKKK